MKNIIFIWIKSVYEKILKNSLKKELHKKVWELNEKNLWECLSKYLNGKPIRNKCGIIQPIIECKCEITIWHNEPCLGEDGPNPGTGTPGRFKQLKGDERFTLDLYDIESEYGKYDINKKSGYHKDFMCSIDFLWKHVQIKEYKIGEWYRYSIGIENDFVIIVAGFDHENSYRGTCEIIFKG